jgi:hypothetical protein
MAFGLQKLAVLESKLDIYEDLSKEMLDKLERAVTTISENSNKIAIVLERHENRLDEGYKANAALIKMVTDHQKYDEKMFSNFSEKLESLEKKVDENQKMLWMVTVSASAIIFVLQMLPQLGLELTPKANAATIVGNEIALQHEFY